MTDAHRHNARAVPTSSGSAGAGSEAPALTVYGTSWCPDVARSRAWLDARRISYVYVDIDVDKHAQKTVRRLQRGRRGVPTVVRPDGAFTVGPADEQLAAFLEEDGSFPPPPSPTNR